MIARAHQLVMDVHNLN